MAIAASEIRRIALALPEVVEMDHHGVPSFRVRSKIFCTLRTDQPRMMVKLDPEDQHNLCAGHPQLIVAVPGYWGTKGSTFVDLAQADGTLADMLLRLAYANVAPKALVASMEAARP
jgi:hypothetical protein